MGGLLCYPRVMYQFSPAHAQHVVGGIYFDLVGRDSVEPAVSTHRGRLDRVSPHLLNGRVYLRSQFGRFLRLIWVCCLLLGSLTHAAEGDDAFLPGIERVVFLGDSITYGGQYIEAL